MLVPDKTAPYVPRYSNPAPPSGHGVVVHSTRSNVEPYWPRELEATLNWFNNPGHDGASSHWVVDRDGTRVRVVPDTKQAWHARECNLTHFGIELCQSRVTDIFPPEQIDSLIELLKAYRDDFGIPPEHHIRGFIGHEETPPGRRDGKTDPGPEFWWSWVIQQLQPAAPVNRVWLYGDEGAGREVVGFQQWEWNRGVVINKFGSPHETGGRGEHWHNVGGVFVLRDV